jgi:hypothetical protein
MAATDPGAGCAHSESVTGGMAMLMNSAGP